MIFMFVSFMFVQNLVTTWGLVLAPLADVRDSRFDSWKTFGFLVLFMILGAAWIYLLDWVFCVLLGLDFLRIFLIFLNLAGFNLLSGLVPPRLASLLRVPGVPEFKLLHLDMVLVGFSMMVLSGGTGFPGFAAAVLGAVAGTGTAIFLFRQVIGRLELEWLPPSVRGKPLAFFAMGLVSMVFLLTGLALHPILSTMQW